MNAAFAVATRRGFLLGCCNTNAFPVLPTLSSLEAHLVNTSFFRVVSSHLLMLLLSGRPPEFHPEVIACPERSRREGSLSFPPRPPSCHPERSEGSLSFPSRDLKAKTEILRFAQNEVIVKSRWLQHAGRQA